MALPLKEMCNKNREKLENHLLWRDYVRQMAHGAEAHKKSSKEMCDAHYMLQSLQKTSKSLCLRRWEF